MNQFKAFLLVLVFPVNFWAQLSPLIVKMDSADLYSISLKLPDEKKLKLIRKVIRNSGRYSKSNLDFEMKSKVIPYLKCFYLIDINSDGKIDVVNNTSALTNYHSNYYRDGYITCIYLSSPVGFNHIPLIGGITALKVGENGAEVYSSLSIGCYDPPATCSCKYFFAKNSDSISTFIRYQLNPLCGHGAKYFPDSFLFSDTLKVVKGMSFENNMWPIDGCILEIGEKAVLLSEKESYYFISFSKSGRNFLIWASKKYFEKN